MRVKSIKVLNFRNLKNQVIHFDKPVNLLLGNNGQGKTNLLEAVSLILRGQSFRPGKIQQAIGLNSPSQTFEVAAEIETKNVTHTVAIKCSNTGVIVRMNGKAASRLALKKLFSCIVFIPDSLLILKEGPEIRRVVVDDLSTLIHPNAHSIQNVFKKTLRTKNRLLFEAKTKTIEKGQFDQLMNTINKQFLQTSVQLMRLRLHAMTVIEPLVAQCARSLFHKDVEISLRYFVDNLVVNRVNFDEVVQKLQELIENNAEKEVRIGSSLYGPHKHEILISFNGLDSRYYCSQGQQRTLILALKMAQILYHTQSQKDGLVLLLDDVMSELDSERRENLVNFLLEKKTQFFVTTTDLSLSQTFATQELNVFNVVNGNLEKSEE